MTTIRLQDDRDTRWVGANFREDEDHSAATTTLLERINATTIPVLLRGTNTPLSSFIGELLALEKIARLGGDVLSTQRLATEVLKILRTQRMLEEMVEKLDFLMKRRGQSKQVQSAMVAECALAVADPDLSEQQKTEALEKLVHATEGKIHVELDHARFTIELGKIVEREGRRREVFDMLQGIQVETITNMPRAEKLNCLNDQIRLSLELGELHLTPIISRKISYRAFLKPETKEAKLKYFELMRQYYASRHQYFLMGRCWFETMETTDVEEDKLSALSHAAVAWLASPHLSAKEIDDAAEFTAFHPSTKVESRDAALARLGQIRRLANELEHINDLVKAFTSVELIRVKVEPLLKDLCANHPFLTSFPDRQRDLYCRCSEHDLLVVAKYYNRAPIGRLARLVGLDSTQVEMFLMDLVTQGMTHAKIDRVDGIVVFQKEKDPSATVNEWNKGTERCTELIDRAAHLVVKERMIHNMPLSR
jgi:26S proteasome regulatory subunit N5